SVRAVQVENVELRVRSTDKEAHHLAEDLLLFAEAREVLVIAFLEILRPSFRRRLRVRIHRNDDQLFHCVPLGGWPEPARTTILVKLPLLEMDRVDGQRTLLKRGVSGRRPAIDGFGAITLRNVRTGPSMLTSDRACWIARLSHMTRSPQRHSCCQSV